MSSPTCIAALLLVFAASTAPSAVVPPDALPEAAQVHPQSAPPPTSSAQAFADWGGPWLLRPNLYNYRHITW